jgi:hypothetical protein
LKFLWIREERAAKCGELRNRDIGIGTPVGRPSSATAVGPPGCSRALPRGLGREETRQNSVNPFASARVLARKLAGAPIRGVRCEIYAKGRQRLDKSFILFFAAARLSHPLIGAPSIVISSVADRPLSGFACGSINRFYRFGV